MVVSAHPTSRNVSQPWRMISSHSLRSRLSASLRVVDSISSSQARALLRGGFKLLVVIWSRRFSGGLLPAFEPRPESARITKVTAVALFLIIRYLHRWCAGQHPSPGRLRECRSFKVGFITCTYASKNANLSAFFDQGSEHAITQCAIMIYHEN